MWLRSEFLVDAVVDDTIYEVVDASSDAQQPVAGPVLVTPKASHQPGNPSKRRKKNHENNAQNDRFDRALNRLERLESKRAEETREERRKNQQMLLQVANSFADALNNLASAIVSKHQ